MNKEEKETIRTNRRYIKDNVFNINDVADKLYEYEILSLENKETIASQPVDRRAFELLDIVVKRGQKAFPGLIEALRDTENQEVADRLEGKSGATNNTNYTNFSVSMVNKSGNSVTRSEESTKSTDSAIRYEGPPGSQSHPPAAGLNKPDVEWMNQVELTKLNENQTPTDPKFVLEMKKCHGENLYNLNMAKRGICMIIDNIPSDFCIAGECHHGVVDAGKTLIRQTLKLCGFKDVNFSRNTGTTKMIKEKILKEMKKLSHSEYSSFFVICVTTGPNPGFIYGKDGESDRMTIKELQDVMSQCEEFQNKPKVLLVHTVPKSSLQCSHSTSLAENQGQKLTESMQHLSLEGEVSSSVNDRNMFAVSAELQPGISFLVRIKGKTGAYFSNALVYVLLKYAGNKSFLELISEMDKLLGSCEDEGLDNVDANPYNEKVHRSIRVAKLKVLTKPEKELFFFPLYEDTGMQVSS
ncbi:uncharacterized protein LOC133196731 [Saccostrea echinata]|uniref:uncharacterized protein LOC133196731 n=1 Tax=Saccostrea echinata TaxID=191078 RepID=UPI002A80B7D4|nr:uncharacterized protein LOC133196731 [Saccostrea echinata]